MIINYEEQVYAGLLGKVIGVFLGRPFEGWTKEKIQERFGSIKRYVHEDLGFKLVVSDDDISGTLTFVRALEDSGLYRETPIERFGDNWLNYLIENKTILWWGGMGVSTEHTAYLRLKKGIKAPASGSIAVNGKSAAEQIGAQIFIDAFGLVAPGNPELAVELASRSARVSHDGEALYGALVVAAMVSAAFVEKDMGNLLDVGVSFVPKDSLIAKVHSDVRAWCKEDNNWEKTYERIKEKYGYEKFLGNCHMIPNHAIMVMAWVYAPDNFKLSQEIINTAGWDTDCNAANVGCVLGVKLGLGAINAQYDFQTPFADRIILPTADGTRHITDVLNEALHIANIGRKVMGWEPSAWPKNGAIHHFAQKGALHGYMVEDQTMEGQGTLHLSNTDGRGLVVEISELSEGKVGRFSTSIMHWDPNTKGGYSIMGTPRLYPGQKVTVKGKCDSLSPEINCRLFFRQLVPKQTEKMQLVYSSQLPLKAGLSFEYSFELPDNQESPYLDLGFEFTGENRCGGRLVLDSIHFSGTPNCVFQAPLLTDVKQCPVGWINGMDGFSDLVFRHRNDVRFYYKNEGRGHLVTGTREWFNYTFTCDFALMNASSAGVIVRYQGQKRYIALVKTPSSIKLIRVCYEETVLAETPVVWKRQEDLHKMQLKCQGETITASCDGEELFTVSEKILTCGGAGILVEEGLAGFREMRVT